MAIKCARPQAEHIYFYWKMLKVKKDIILAVKCIIGCTISSVENSSMVTLNWPTNSKGDHLTIFNWINWVLYFIFNWINVHAIVHLPAYYIPIKPSIRLIRPLIRLMRPLIRLIRPWIRPFKPPIRLLRPTIRPIWPRTKGQKDQMTPKSSWIFEKLNRIFPLLSKVPKKALEKLPYSGEILIWWHNCCILPTKWQKGKRIIWSKRRTRTKRTKGQMDKKAKGQNDKSTNRTKLKKRTNWLREGFQKKPAN